MSEKKSTDSRRKLLKSIAAGSGAVVAGKSLPESWAKPVINSVVLPAHAATTDDGSGSEGGDQTTAAPTTTEAPCYVRAGSYCGDLTNSSSTIMIVVDSQGGLTISIRRSNGDTWSGTDTTGAGGGEFLDVQLTRIGWRSYLVSGNLLCENSVISGTWDYPGSAGGTFPAELDTCPQ